MCSLTVTCMRGCSIIHYIKTVMVDFEMVVTKCKWQEKFNIKINCDNFIPV